MTISIFIPCVFVLIFYIKIFIHAIQARQRVMTRSRINELKRSLLISKGLFGSYVLFTICWLPYALVIMIDFEDNLPREYYVVTMLLAVLNSTLNPIFYGLTNPKFKHGYRNVVSLILYRKVATPNPRSSGNSKSEKFDKI